MRGASLLMEKDQLDCDINGVREIRRLLALHQAAFIDAAPHYLRNAAQHIFDVLQLLCRA